MIERHDILCFAPGPWDDIWRNRHQIMTRLARANRVLYVEPWPELRPTLRQWRQGQLSWADMHGPRLRKVQENLYVYSPASWAPRASRFPLSAATDAIYMASLRRVLKRLRFQRPILWLFLPEMESFIGRFDEKLVIYHMVDEYSGYSGVSAAWRPVVQQMEQELARRADLVFVTSPDLLERKRELNQRTVLIPNAVDYEAFSAAADRGPEAAPPADMADLRLPVAGYVGAINDKLDLDLLLRVARECAQPCQPRYPAESAERSSGERGTEYLWSFAMVGPVTIRTAEGQQALEALRALPNVHFLGCKTVADVPAYVAACSVCLLPYQITEWTRNIDSLKLYEYLACGKPVVATDVPAARRFSGVVSIAANTGEFISSMNNALNEDSPALRAQRRRLAAQNTWEQRVTVLSAAVESALRSVRHPAPCAGKEGEKQQHGC
jgi:glycosyltransferase involved in cell wall biosynthesis